MAKWFYYGANGEKIEVTGDRLKGLAKAGVVTPDTMIETEDGKTAPAKKVKGLTFAEAAPPVETPSAESSPFTTEEQAEIDKFCAKFGNDVKTVDEEGVQLLYRATELGNIAVVKFLVAKGADVNATDKEGGTALQESAYTGKVKIVSFLISKGANVNAATNRGDTPLLFAADRGNIEVAKILIAEGAVIDAKNNVGTTALHAAANKGNTDFVNFLISVGINVNAKNNDGLTPLHFAADKGHVEVAKVLVSAGANVKAKDNIYSFTPLDAAKKARKEAVIQYLSSMSTPSSVASSSLITVNHVSSDGTRTESGIPILKKRLSSFSNSFKIFGIISCVVLGLFLPCVALSSSESARIFLRAKERKKTEERQREQELAEAKQALVVAKERVKRAEALTEPESLDKIDAATVALIEANRQRYTEISPNYRQQWDQLTDKGKLDSIRSYVQREPRDALYAYLSAERKMTQLSIVGFEYDRDLGEFKRKERIPEGGFLDAVVAGLSIHAHENTGLYVLIGLGLIALCPVLFFWFRATITLCPSCKRSRAVAFQTIFRRRATCKCRHCGYAWINEFTDWVDPPPPSTGSSGVSFRYTSRGIAYRRR